MKSAIANVKELIRKNQVTLVLVDNESYNARVMELCKSLSQKTDTILYVTLNRPCMRILKDFARYKIDPKRFRIIDVVSKDVKASEPREGCTYVSSSGLTELSVRISEVLKAENPKILIFDSFHTMMAYEERNIITRFAHDLITKLSTCDCKGVIPLIKSDRDVPLTADLEMFVDEVVELV